MRARTRRGSDDAENRGFTTRLHRSHLTPGRGEFYRLGRVMTTFVTGLHFVVFACLTLTRPLGPNP